MFQFSVQEPGFLTEVLVQDPDVGIELEDEENSAGLMYLPPQSPRGLSSRASQMSSLHHSHSGSIEMNEVSLISSRARSFEQELRGSSLSSEEGTNGNDPSSTGATGNLSSARSLSVETGPLRPPSPRHDRYKASLIHCFLIIIFSTHVSCLY